MTSKELAAYLGLSPEWLNTHRAEGPEYYSDKTHKFLYAEEAVERWLQSCYAPVKFRMGESK